MNMSTTGNRYDNADIEALKTLTSKGVNLSNNETFDDVTQEFFHFIEKVYNKAWLGSALK